MAGKDIKCEKNEEMNVCGKLCETSCNNPNSDSELCPPIVSPGITELSNRRRIRVLKLNLRINFSRATRKLREIVDARTVL